MRRIRIEGDGTAWGTKVYDAETERQIPGVAKVEITIDTATPELQHAVLTMTDGNARMPVLVYLNVTTDAETKP